MAIAAFFLGIIVGMLLSFFIYSYLQRQRRTDLSALQSTLKQEFLEISLDIQNKNTEHFLSIAHQTLAQQSERHVQTLDSKKDLIDQSLTGIKKEMDKVQLAIQTLERDQGKTQGEIQAHLKFSTAETRKLSETTSQLREALANSKTRGQWGERMAEDVLRLTGLVEGINYMKQKAIDQSRSIPDFTFLLPHDLKLNMDVKFPLTHYLHYMSAPSEPEKLQSKQAFLRDVKARIREVTSKDYINPEANTVDYALIFIPNEHIYSFIHEHDPNLIDDALRNKAIFCSPLSLYALLAVIRQAIDNFAIQKKASEMLSLIGAFNRQWEKFNESLDKMGKRIVDAHQEFQTLVTTRKTQLEKPLQKIEALRKDHNIDILELGNATVPLMEITPVALVTPFPPPPPSLHPPRKDRV